MHLHSPAFTDGATIPVDHTGDGRDLSPPLEWSDVPEGTRGFALVMDDPDAPPGVWVHWVLYAIPAARRSLPAGLAKIPELPDGSRQGSCWGVDRFDRLGYQGPLPPPGPAHRYRFLLTALDRPLDLPAGASVAELRQAISGHVLAEARLIGRYARRS